MERLNLEQQDILINFVNRLISHYKNTYVYDNFLDAKKKSGCLYRRIIIDYDWIEVVAICELIAHYCENNLFDSAPVIIMHKLLERPFVTRSSPYVWTTTRLGRKARLLFLYKVRDAINENKNPEIIFELYNSIQWKS